MFKNQETFDVFAIKTQESDLAFGAMYLTGTQKYLVRSAFLKLQPTSVVPRRNI